MFAVAAVLAFAASAMALQVTQPSNSSGWTTSGPNTVAWSSVSTDATNFTIILNDQSTYPAYSEVLVALAITSSGSVVVNPPSGGWVAGSGYRVNLVKDANDLDDIFAQSDDFTIQQTSSSTFSSSTASGSSSSTGSVSVTSTSASVSGSSASGSSTGSSSASGSSSSNAAPALGVQTGFFGLFALLGIALA